MTTPKPNVSETVQAILVRGGTVFAPHPLGEADILIAAGRILAVGRNVGAAASALGATVIDARGLRVTPGFIDQHVHLIGGGDGAGPRGRVPELTALDLLSGGTTTAVGLLGVDTQTRGLPLLLRKAHELGQAGVSAFIYTGGMPLPPPHLLQSIVADVSFIDQVLGAKTALAEKLHPNRDRAALAHLAGELMQARAMSGKAAVLHCHIGGLAEGLDAIFHLADELGMPVDQIVPTHVNRTPEFSPVFAHALRFAKAGGTIDFTCCVSRRDGFATAYDVVEAVRLAREAGVPLQQMTMSTDGNIPLSMRNAAGNVTGLRIAPPATLHRDLVSLVREGGLPLEDALTLVTTNVARVLGLAHRKGRIAAGHDADVVLLDAADRVDTVIASGRVAIRDGKALSNGPFVLQGGARS